MLPLCFLADAFCVARQLSVSGWRSRLSGASSAEDDASARRVGGHVNTSQEQLRNRWRRRQHRVELRERVVAPCRTPGRPIATLRVPRATSAPNSASTPPRILETVAEKVARMGVAATAAGNRWSGNRQAIRTWPSVWQLLGRFFDAGALPTSTTTGSTFDGAEAARTGLVAGSGVRQPHQLPS
jgi:hypothetical protein